MNKLLILSFLFLIIAGCNENDDATTGINCNEVACTEEFVTLLVSIKDNSGVVISLDRFEVINKDTQQDVTIPLSDSGFKFARDNGQYPLYNDTYVSENQNTQTSIIFRGFIENNIVAEAEYVINIDCCHISLASGNPEIIIN